MSPKEKWKSWLFDLKSLELKETFDEKLLEVDEEVRVFCYGSY